MQNVLKVEILICYTRNSLHVFQLFLLNLNYVFIPILLLYVTFIWDPNKFGTVPPGCILYGGTVPLGCVLSGGIVPPGCVLSGGTVPPRGGILSGGTVPPFNLSLLKNLIGNWHIALFSEWSIILAMKCLSLGLNETVSYIISWSPTSINKILFKSACIYFKNRLLDGKP